MLDGILPESLFIIIEKHINKKVLNELRIRAGKPITLFLGGLSYFLGESGLVSNLSDAIIATKSMVEDIVFRASECSVYAVNEQIKKGFIVTRGGVRLGLAGHVVTENGEVRTITDFSSVNIRVPHEIKNCSLSAFDHILTESGIKNTLIISPPGCGKTTFIRDFVYQLSHKNYSYNVLVLDERGELNINDSLGHFSDVLMFIGKRAGFENGIRAMSPHIIVTDELGGEEDSEAVAYAANSGVKVLATAHASNLDDLLKKDVFKKLIKDKSFDRYVVLSSRSGPGTFEGIYNENLSRITRFS